MRWFATWLLSCVLVQAQTTTVNLAWDTVTNTPTVTVTNYFLYVGIGGSTPATNVNYYIRQAVIPVAGSTQTVSVVVNNGPTTFWVTAASVFAESPPSTALNVTIPVPSTPPSCSLTASATTILRGQTTTLAWNVINASATGALLTPGVGSVSATAGSVVLTPSNSTDYVLTVWNDYGTNTCTVPITVTYPAPTFTFTRSPSAILLGASATLSWSAITDATSAVLNPGTLSISTNGGSLVVTPSVTTTYTNTATGPGGTTTKYAVVTVNPVLTSTFTANPTTLIQGSSATLNWQTFGLCSGVTINNGVGAKPCGVGSQIVTPSATTTYTMITSGTGGPVTNTLQIVVVAPPPPAQYALVVNSGSGDGSYTNGTVVTVIADAVAGFTFSTWTGFTVAVAGNSTTTLTMPANATNVTATYTQNVPPPPTYYTLTVNNGTGSGSYTNAQLVPIVANAPPATYTFWKWTGDGVIADILASTTTVTMRTNAATVTANYLPPLVPPPVPPDPTVAVTAMRKAILIR